MSLSIIDILFLITVILLVFNGLRNGAVFSLISLIGLPLGVAIAYIYGPGLTDLLAANNLSVTPLIAYGILFFGTILIVHIISTFVRGIIKKIPLISQGDTLLGGVFGFVEAWLVWLLLLIILGTFLASTQADINQNSQIIAATGIQVDQFKSWHDFYNQAVTNSLFAQVNSFFIKALPNLPQLPQ